MSPPRDPSHGQTAEEIERYYSNVKIGDLAAVRNSQYGRLEIKITTVSNTNPEAGSIHLNDEAAWGGVAYSVKSGKNFYAPNSQSSLIVPSEKVAAWAKANPRGILDS